MDIRPERGLFSASQYLKFVDISYLAVLAIGSSTSFPLINLIVFGKQRKPRS